MEVGFVAQQRCDLRPVLACHDPIPVGGEARGEAAKRLVADVGPDIVHVPRTRVSAVKSFFVRLHGDPAVLKIAT